MFGDFSFEHIAILDPIFDWIESLLTHQATLAPIGLLIVEEIGIPLPVPGDIIVAYTGYNVSQNLVPYALALSSIVLAVIIGSSILYYLSYRWGQNILNKFSGFLHLNPKRVRLVEDKFRNYGFLTIAVGRHIPGFRIAVTVFAGTTKVPYRIFLAATTLSTVIWGMFYLYIGRLVGRKIGVYLHKPSFLIISIAIVVFITTLFFAFTRSEDK